MRFKTQAAVLGDAEPLHQDASAENDRERERNLCVANAEASSNLPVTLSAIADGPRQPAEDSYAVESILLLQGPLER